MDNVTTDNAPTTVEQVTLAEPTWITLAEAAKRAKISDVSMWNRINEGRVTARKEPTHHGRKFRWIVDAATVVPNQKPWSTGAGHKKKRKTKVAPPAPTERPNVDAMATKALDVMIQRAVERLADLRRARAILRGER